MSQREAAALNSSAILGGPESPRSSRSGPMFPQAPVSPTHARSEPVVPQAPVSPTNTRSLRSSGIVPEAPISPTQTRGGPMFPQAPVSPTHARSGPIIPQVPASPNHARSEPYIQEAAPPNALGSPSRSERTPPQPVSPTRADPTLAAVEHQQGESTVVQSAQQTNPSDAQARKDTSVNQGWNFGNLGPRPPTAGAGRDPSQPNNSGGLFGLLGSFSSTNPASNAASTAATSNAATGNRDGDAAATLPQSSGGGPSTTIASGSSSGIAGLGTVGRLRVADPSDDPSGVNEICAICTEEVTDDHSHLHPCEHQFHFACIASWFEMQQVEVQQIHLQQRASRRRESQQRRLERRELEQRELRSVLTCPNCRRVPETVTFVANGSPTTINADGKWSETGPSPWPPLVPAADPPRSDTSMLDRFPTPLSISPADEIYRGQTVPHGMTPDIDRTNPSVTILKRVIGVLSARNRGFRVLLESHSRNPDHPEAMIHELEASSRHPGAANDWLEENGSVMELAPISNLNGRRWSELEVTSVANVLQVIRIHNGDSVQMPQRNAESIVMVQSRDGEIGADWYKMSDLNSKFGAILVRPSVHAVRVFTGQHVPMEPLPGQRRRTNIQEHTTRPLSEYPEVAARVAIAANTTRAPARQGITGQRNPDLESQLEQLLFEVRQSRGPPAVVPIPSEIGEAEGEVDQTQRGNLAVLNTFLQFAELQDTAVRLDALNAETRLVDEQAERILGGRAESDEQELEQLRQLIGQYARLLTRARRVERGQPPSESTL